MDMFHFAERIKLKYVHHTVVTYSRIQWATALSSEKADSVITYLLDVMAIVGIHVQIKTNSAPACVQNLCLMSQESPGMEQKKIQN